MEGPVYIHALSDLAQASVLAALAGFFVPLFDRCKNGVLPNLRLVAAINAEQAKKTILFGSYAHAGSEVVGGYIRCVAAQYRMVATDEKKFRTCMNKVGL